ncbi:MAG: adenosylcobinamide-phosphate synthase CbiB [Nitrospirota bacterium]
MGITEEMLIVLLAFILDLIFGDPQWLPHPVRWIGKVINCLELVLRKTRLPLKVSGLFLTGIVVSMTFGISYLVISSAYMLSHYLGFIVSALLLYTTLSARSLFKESMKVYQDLRGDHLKAARESLSRIVGRDTDSLDKGGIIRGAVETVAENTVDGVIAPLIYAFLGGPVLALTYKAVNTLDSMVGYKDERYIDLGWASARLDDLANYLPARLSGLLIPIAAFLCGKDWKNSFKIAARDHNNHPSPNSGIPESAMAGALRVRLGGPNYYQGIPFLKPLIGQADNDLSVEDIKEANKIMIVSSILMVISGLMLLWVGSTFS